MAFAIIYTEYLKRVLVGAYPDKVTAQAAVDGTADVWSGWAIEAENDLIEWAPKKLVDVFNAIRPEGEAIVAKFENREKGSRRLLTRLAGFKEPLPPSAMRAIASEGDHPVDGDSPPDGPAAAEGEVEMATAKKGARKGIKKAAAEGRKKVAAVKTPKPPKAPRVKKAKDDKPGLPREGSKSDKLLKLLQRENGATWTEMINATGWATVHGRMGVLAKAAGGKLERVVEEGKVTRWKIA